MRSVCGIAFALSSGSYSHIVCQLRSTQTESVAGSDFNSRDAPRARWTGNDAKPRRSAIRLLPVRHIEFERGR
ncbi:hypothetical protein chiPu_0013683 [Chiloscyllium punctatum]|uniref:Uncharacterized protein n=1 Tax=Chiloscyllium punctatum TaxID=137246 RepID=A0A401SXT9_CHIPU|nr:hypothetical protein [Chiloscyllium punctatum]